MGSFALFPTSTKLSSYTILQSQPFTWWPTGFNSAHNTGILLEVTVLWTQVLQNITKNNKTHITTRQWTSALLQNTIHYDHSHKQMVLKLKLTITPVLLKVFKDNYNETEGWYTGIRPSNFANIQITLQILVQIPSCLASLAPRKLVKTAMLNLVQFIIHKYRDSELCAFITSALDVVANFMLQPLSFW